MAQFVNDTFTAANGTELTAHAGETGATWTDQYSVGTGKVQIFSNGLVVLRPAPFDATFRASGTPAGADYSVSASLGKDGTADASQYVGLLLRCADSNNFYYCLWNDANNLWHVGKKVAGTGTDLATNNAAGPVNGDAIVFSASGTTLTLKKNGATIITTTDAALSAAGKAGIFCGCNSVGTVNAGKYTFDYVTADDTPPAAPAVSPTAATIDQLDTIALSASGFTGGAVNWSSLTPTVATVSGSGVVTGVAHGNAANQTATVRATGQANGTETADCVVTVRAVAVAVTPKTPAVPYLGTVQLAATVTGSTNLGKTWSLQSGGGSVSASGLYNAPGVDTTAVVRATSTADAARYDESTITVSNVRVVAAAAYWGTTYTGLGDVGFTVYRADATLHAARTTTGLGEVGTSGTYETQVSLPVGFNGVVLIDSPSVALLAVHEVEAAPVAGSRSVVLCSPFGASYSGQSLTYTVYNPDRTVNSGPAALAECGTTGVYVAGPTLAAGFSGFAAMTAPAGLSGYGRDIDTAPVGGTVGVPRVYT